jgi:hypothetical protein
LIASGLAMIVVGAWVTLQAIGANLAGRIRTWAFTSSAPLGGPGGGGGGGALKPL